MSAFVEIIKAKRDGHALSREQIALFIEGCASGSIPDYQISALLVAGFLRGMNADETAAMTQCMLESGLVLDFSDAPGPVVDKHSTGGIGDKLSLVLGPIAAACGLNIPMITGRGLGITGGTWDKLDSIPGFSAHLTLPQMYAQMAELGIFITGQIKEIATADQRLYALRDVTATVDSIPYISASIMSKKLAEGLDGLVLDVKCGRGAFMKTEEEARALAESLVGIGWNCGVRTHALLTRMDVPLGRAVGNWIEVVESVDCLQGGGEPDVMEASLALSGEMLLVGGLVETAEEGLARAQDAVNSGRAFDKFVQFVEAQGGNVGVVKDPHARTLDAPETVVHAPRSAQGYVADVDAEAIGWAATKLGVGRIVKEDDVDWDAGIYLHKRPGERIAPGEPVASFYTHKTDRVQEFRSSIARAYRFADDAPAHRPVVMDKLLRDGWQSQA